MTRCRHPALGRLGLALLLAGTPVCAWAGECASPGRDGAGSISGTLNGYWSGQGNPSPGATSFVLGPATGASTPISPGDLVLLFQTQDGNINSTNTSAYGGNDGSGTGLSSIRRTGRFEFARATSSVPVGGGTLTVATGVQYDYTRAAPTGSQGRRRYQVLRVPQLLDATLSGTVTAAPWDGERGGVVALDVANTLTFSGGTVDVSGRGFRGGGGRGSTTGSGSDTDYRTPFSNGANGSKGEGVAGTPRLVWDSRAASFTDRGAGTGYPNGSFARGAPGNAGGGGTDGNPSINDQNTGGGGGGGLGPGGQGGEAWCGAGPPNCDDSGGLGGAGLAQQGVARLSLGGGGGAGSTNNATGDRGALSSSGANGGGVVLIRAGVLTGSGTVLATGADADDSVDNDGSGGGGGGGSVLIGADSSSGLSLTVNVRGGEGGDNSNSSPHGPGGGGGGGLVATTNGVTGVTAQVAGGPAGTTDGFSNPPRQTYGAESGDGGTATLVSPADVPGFSSGRECRVDVAKAFGAATTTAGSPFALTVTLTNPNPTLPMNALAVTDPLPSGVTVAPAPDASTTCAGGTVTAAAGAGTVSLSGATLPALATCEIELDVVASAGGSYTNVIPAGNATATINGTPVPSTEPAEATISATEPLTASKSVALVSGTHAVPGETVEYTISFANPSGSGGPASDVVIIDALPPEAQFVSADIAGAGSGPARFVDGNPSTTLQPGFGYSDDNGATFTYTPQGSVDDNVTHIRFAPSGSMAAGTSAEIRFRMLIP